MSDTKTIIFDFDGTLADSLTLVIEIIQQIVPGHDGATKEQIETLRGKPARELARFLGVPIWKAPMLIRRGQKIMQNRLSEVPVFPGMTDVLEAFGEKGYSVHLISFNSAENVKKFIETNELDTYFESITGSVGLFGKSKAIRKLCRSTKVSRGDVWYVGDEVRDVVAAKKAGVHMVAVGWGFNRPDALRAMEPDAVAATPKDLTNFILKA